MAAPARALSNVVVDDGAPVTQLGRALLLEGIPLEHVIQIENANQRKAGSGASVATVARELGVSSDTVAKAQARAYRYEYVARLEGLEPDIKVMEEYGLDRCHKGCLALFAGPVLIMGDPSLMEAIEDISSLLGERPKVCVAPTPLIREFLSPLSSEHLVVAKEHLPNDVSQVEIVKDGRELLSNILREAAKLLATDIHLEPRPDGGGRVRFRRDGILSEVAGLSVNKPDMELVTNGIFIQSGMDAAKKNKFQDGKMVWKTDQGGHFVTDVRVSQIPTVHGPSTVMRLLVRDERLESLKALGYPVEDREIIENMGMAPHGLLVMTGPTGSGKTTTLYSVVRMQQGVHKKILSVEDPVEVQLPHVQQVQVNELAGVTFADSIRAFLRQDPDVMLIGEIRDETTAEAAVRAAQTGHLVLTSVHSNSATSTVLRLMNLGVKRSDLATELIGVVSQRLVRKLCPDCKEIVSIKRMGVPDILVNRLEALKITTVGRPVGCKKCSNSGYKGRKVVCEILEVGPVIRKIIEDGGDVSKLEEFLSKEHWRTLADKAIDLVNLGITSLSEVTRVENLMAWARWSR
jgi:type IV pilus assembly protein PilB